MHHEHVDLLKQLFDIAKSKFLAGQGTRVDVLKAQVELSNLYQRLPVLEQQRETMAAKLNTLLNRDPRGPLGIPRAPVPIGWDKPVEDVERSALMSRSELKAAELAIEKGEQVRASRNDSTIPTLKCPCSDSRISRRRMASAAIASINIPFSFWTKRKYDGKGGKSGPDLSDVGRKRDAQWLERFLMSPSTVIPKAKMPSLKGGADERQALVAYLLSLQ